VPAAEYSREAIELVRRHGWSEEPVAGLAYAVLGALLVFQGRLAEAEPWLNHAEQTLPPEGQPAAGLGLCYARGLLELARGHPGNSLAAFQTTGRLRRQLVTPHTFAAVTRAHGLQSLVQLGETERAEAVLAGMDPHERDTGEMHIALAVLRLARRDPQAAAAALAPVLNGSAPIAANNNLWVGMVQAFLLEAIARDALGDPATAGSALEHAFDLAEHDGILLPFLLHPAPELLHRHARHRTAHAALTGQILDLLTGTATEKPAPGPAHLQEPLSDSETRILRYLPTNLTAPEIAGQLYVSVHTVKTHMRHLYAKLGTHHRAETVEQARTLGLLAPALRKP
jgi:LuxR family maltose regulon positive regulatory protein